MCWTLYIAVKLIITCPTLRESFVWAHANTYDPMVYGEAGMSGESREADVLSEIAFGL